MNGTTTALECMEYAVNTGIRTNWITLSTTAQLAANDAVTVAVIPLASGPALRVSEMNFTESSFTATKLQ